MDILLRKARSLATAAVEAAGKIELATTIKLSVHTLPANTFLPEMTRNLLAASSSDLIARIKQVTDLYEAESAIRILADKANTKKVRPLLAEKHLLDALERVLNGVLLSVPKAASYRHPLYNNDTVVRLDHDAGAMYNTIVNIRTRQETLTSGSVPDIEVTALASTEQLETKIASIKRRRSDLMIELAQANLSETIKLPENVVITLRQHGLVE